MPDQSRAESNKILLDGKKKKFGISIQPGSAISVPQIGSAVSGAIIEEEFEEVNKYFLDKFYYTFSLGVKDLV